MRRRRTSQSHAGYSYRLGGRYLVFLCILLAMFAYLLSGVFGLQLLESEDYTQTAETRRTKTITLRGSRGMITDSDAVILAYDEDIYNVTFYRDASQNSKKEYAELTDSIRRTIDIIEAGGNELKVSSVIRRKVEKDEEGNIIETAEPGPWEFHFGSGVSESVLQTRESAQFPFIPRRSRPRSVSEKEIRHSCIHKQ